MRSKRVGYAVSHIAVQVHILHGGIKITDMKNGKLSEFTDIHKGFIVTQIDDEAVNNVQDFLNIMKEKNGKVLVEGIYPNRPMSYLYAFRM